MREASLLASCQRCLEQFCRQQGGRAAFRKRHGGPWGPAGDPDLYLCYRGIHAEIELKRVNGKLTRLQQERMRAWAAAGAQVTIVHSVEELKKFLEKLTEKSKLPIT